MGQLFNKICLERLLLAIVVLLETHCYKTLIQLAPVEAQPQANLSKQPGNSCFKIQLEMERWADTCKTWLNQHPCHVCSYGWSTAVSRAVKLVRHLGGGGDGGTDHNKTKNNTNTSREEKGILHPVLLEGASIFLREKNKPTEQLIAQVESQLENYRDKPCTFWLLYPALETHLNKSGK